ncbi:MAG: hypothetical protein H6709_21340 [Kofleriaceae bacterium]|nr:hypothetical protein [Kofleriaceae bacterium]
MVALRRAVALEPAPATQVALGRALVQAGQVDDARAALRAPAPAPPAARRRRCRSRSSCCRPRARPGAQRAAAVAALDAASAEAAALDAGDLATAYRDAGSRRRTPPESRRCAPAPPATPRPCWPPRIGSPTAPTSASAAISPSPPWPPAIATPRCGGCARWPS